MCSSPQRDMRSRPWQRWFLVARAAVCKVYLRTGAEQSVGVAHCFKGSKVSLQLVGITKVSKVSKVDAH